MTMVTALFVQTNGCYFGLDYVDPWDVRRDARLYNGPFAVVAHPPCARWSSYWFGSPSSKIRYKLGDDGGCFESAIASVRKFGGVLEHPGGTHAWKHFGLLKPPEYGGGFGEWIKADSVGWTCSVQQGHYGHSAKKRTWLYAVGAKLPMLETGSAKSKIDFERLSKKERNATPAAFRNLLINMAQSVTVP